MAEEVGPGKNGWPAHGFSGGFEKFRCYCGWEYASKMALNSHVEKESVAPYQMELAVARAIWEEGLRIAKEENAALRALMKAVAPCCSWGYAGVACDDHIALRAAIEEDE